MLVLWLLMFRGLALELRNHLPSSLWHDFWDTAFTGSSALLVVLFGVAIGNVIRGVPLDAAGYFAGTFAFLLNPYALGVGFFAAVILLAYHGSAFAMMRIDGPPARRARRAAIRLWPVLAFTYAALTLATFVMRPHALTHPPIELGVAFVAVIATIFSLRSALCERSRDAFIGSAIFAAALPATAAATIYPYLVPAFPSATAGGITIDDANPSSIALTTATVITVVGVVVVLIYTSLVTRRLRGKFTVPSEPS